MTMSDSVDAARREADSLIGRYGVLGVGRTDNGLVFFISNASNAQERIRSWSAGRDIPVEVRVVERFRAADL